VRVLYFGTYERAYPRNAQVISCLRGAGVEVLERHVAPGPVERHAWSAGVGRALRLTVAELRLLAGPRPPFDVMIVGYPGHLDIPVARLVAKARPVVFNPLVSLWDTLVEDRGRFTPTSPAARLLRRIDRRAFTGADLVVADTEAQRRYFSDSFGLRADRVEVCFVGAEDRLFRPGWQPRARFQALFVGKLIPLHGLETILEAARLLPRIPFRLIGSGQLEQLLAARPANVEWIPWVDYDKLPVVINAAGCALGVFSTSPKAARVIPNKVYQALASGIPVVTADTHAARELLVHERDALLVPPGDPAALAAAITRLAGNELLARALGGAGRKTYESHASEKVLGRRWRELLERLIAR
jgi:glycosyltransferase involved in cell wall biosynthesis